MYMARAKDALFTMGSPTGLFVHSADEVPEESYQLPGGTRFFNIFHPLDSRARQNPIERHIDHTYAVTYIIYIILNA